MDLRAWIINSVQVLGKFAVVAAAVAVIAQVLAAFGFPILEAILREASDRIPAYVLPSVYVSHLLVGVLATWSLLKGREFITATNVGGLLQEVDDIQESYLGEQAKVASYRGQTEVLIAKSAAIQGAVSVLHGLLLRSPSRGIARSEIEALLAPLIKDRSRALEFSAADLYNFVVYLHDSHTDTLEIIFRDSDNRIETHNRSWQRGRGHVGSAFAQAATVVVRDSSKEGTHLSSDILPTDSNFYVSFVLSPIPPPRRQARDPIGLFVMTSNRASHFDEDDRILADTISLILSVYISARNAVPGGSRRGRRKDH